MTDRIDIDLQRGLFTTESTCTVWWPLIVAFLIAAFTAGLFIGLKIGTQKANHDTSTR